MNIAEAGAALRKKKISCRELTGECLNAIKRLNPVLNAFVTVCEESARTRAAELDEELENGIDRGPLHGIPIAHKDLLCTKGILTTSGSRLFDGYAPDYDATVVVKLHEAGAVMLGKTGLHELAYGITSNNPHFGAVRNPYDPNRIPGGSSGGSGAAVAAGMCFMATGTDTGGSIRIPASFCGTAGLKPTYGRVSRYGVRPLGFSLDHVGPLARTVRDTALALHAMAGFDDRDPSSSRAAVTEYIPPSPCPLGSLRIGLPQGGYFDGVAAEVRGAVQAAAHAAEAVGARVIPVKVPDIDALNVVARTILLAEASAVFESQLNRRELFGADVLALLDQGRLIPATVYINAQRLRKQLVQDWSFIFSSVDCLLTPTTPTAAPLIDQKTLELDGEKHDMRLATTRFMRGINLLGFPALSLPFGATAEGLPIGVQIIGRPFQEHRVLRIGAALEDAAPKLKPPQL